MHARVAETYTPEIPAEMHGCSRDRLEKRRREAGTHRGVRERQLLLLHGCIYYIGDTVLAQES